MVERDEEEKEEDAEEEEEDAEEEEKKIRDGLKMKIIMEKKLRKKRSRKFF